jgi:TRAP-type C4-dicarboxylate transport system substrate-binding protein
MPAIRLLRRTFVGSMFALSLAGGSVLAQTPQKWDMPSAYGGNSFIVKSFSDFADDVRARTDGMIDIVVHPGGSLYSGAEIMRAVRDGQVPIGERFMGAHANEDLIFGLDTLPFLATSQEDAWNLYQASKPALEAALAERNLKLLYTQLWAPQGLYSVREINSVEDMKGLRYRAYDANTQRLAELTGAIPTRTEAAEVAQAFSTGIAEAMTASGAIGISQSIWDFADYFYRVNAWMPKSVVMVNMDTWNGLDEATRTALEEAATDAEQKVWATMLEAEKADNETLASNGMQVLEPSAELADGLKAIGAQMTDEWIEAAGERGAAIVADYRAR